jgi:hypothetical protein
MSNHKSLNTFEWLPAILGGMAAIGVSALLGTLVSNVSLWTLLAKGLSHEQAYAVIWAFDLRSLPVILSLCVVAIAGFSGGYASTRYGGVNHVKQSLVAGIFATTFFLVMFFSPVSSNTPLWYVATNVVILLLSSFSGGYIYSRRS